MVTSLNIIKAIGRSTQSLILRFYGNSEGACKLVSTYIPGHQKEKKNGGLQPATHVWSG